MDFLIKFRSIVTIPKTAAVLVTGSFLIALSMNRPYAFQKKNSPYIKKIKKYLVHHSPKTSATEISLAFIFGDKRILGKEVKEHYKLMNLLHLFTPSGLHLSSLLLFLAPLFSFIRQKSPRLGKLLEISLLSPIFFLEKFYSLKRVALFRALSLFLRNRAFFDNNFNIFLLVFFIDLFWNFQSSPLSFSFSFLFWGVILSSGRILTIKLPIALFLTQMIVSMFFETPLSYLGCLLSFFLTSLFIFVFPVMLLYLVCSSHFNVSLGYLEIVIEAFHQLICSLAIFSKTLGTFQANMFIVLLCIGLNFKLSARQKYFVCGCFVLTSFSCL
jgi:hypothetical protein